MIALDDLIDRAIQAKTGDKEFVLYRHSENEWTAGIGNPSDYVLIGEGDAEFSASGISAQDAVKNLILKLLET